MAYRLPDHPRVCGKNLSIGDFGRTTTGSPPRVREKHMNSRVLVSKVGITPACAGKPIFVEQFHAVVRVTPACAGKTRYSSALHTIVWDHPRVCGKNLHYAHDVDAWQGSPPRMREKHMNSRVLVSKVGITPACAGKTSL